MWCSYCARPCALPVLVNGGKYIACDPEHARLLKNLLRSQQRANADPTQGLGLRTLGPTVALGWEKEGETWGPLKRTVPNWARL